MAQQDNSHLLKEIFRGVPTSFDNKVEKIDPDEKLIKDIVKNATNKHGDIKMEKCLDGENYKYYTPTVYYCPEGEFQFDTTINPQDLKDMMDELLNENWDISGTFRMKIDNALRLLEGFVNEVDEVYNLCFEDVPDYYVEGYKLKLTIQYQELLDIDKLMITIFAWYE